MTRNEIKGHTHTPFCVITQRVVVISDVSGQPISPSGVLNPEDGGDRLSRNVSTTTHCVIIQWSAVLSYFAVEA